MWLLESTKEAWESFYNIDWNKADVLSPRFMTENYNLLHITGTSWRWTREELDRVSEKKEDSPATNPARSRQASVQEVRHLQIIGPEWIRAEDQRCSDILNFQNLQFCNMDPETPGGTDPGPRSEAREKEKETGPLRFYRLLFFTGFYLISGSS